MPPDDHMQKHMHMNMQNYENASGIAKCPSWDLK